MPQYEGCAGSKRPFGPFGDGKCQHCSATFGASRTATAQAEGGLKINAAWPEISALLFEESSQAKTSGGSNGTSFLNQPSTCFTGSDLTVMLPSLSTSSAPCAVNTAPTQLAVSGVWPIANPNGWPALWHFSAAVRKKSQVHLSVSSLFGGAPAGYICVRSRPTASLKMSMRPTEGSVSVFGIAGGAIQWPFCLPT